MMKMVIRMNDDKINIEKRYPLESIYSTIDKLFMKKGLTKLPESNRTLVYCGADRPVDFAYFGVIVNFLKKQPWFMDNVSVWLLCSNDDSEDPNDFDEEDLLKHYREKQMAGV